MGICFPMGRCGQTVVGFYFYKWGMGRLIFGSCEFDLDGMDCLARGTTGKLPMHFCAEPGLPTIFRRFVGQLTKYRWL
jgi:hypothetical protein